MTEFSSAPFPQTRLRRLRQHPQIRRLVQTERLAAQQFVLPLFVREGKDLCQPIESMPGQSQWSLDRLEPQLVAAAEANLGGVILFGIPGHKDETGSAAWQEDGIIQKAIQLAKRAVPQLLVMTDVCCCEYTSHGHCGIVTHQTGRADVANDATLPLLAKQVVSHAEAGADLVAPSGMMDGMIAAIRAALDGAGYQHLPIMSYAAKYASGFYGPFREAAESAPQSGDRRGYQMDYAGEPAQALREVQLDLQEGADMVMVKPALAYLDILHAVRTTFPGVPLAAYNVSGEYSMIKAAAARGWIDERSLVLETLTAMQRAGASILLTYWALDAARWLREAQ